MLLLSVNHWTREGQGREKRAVPRGSAYSLEIPAAPALTLSRRGDGRGRTGRTAEEEGRSVTWAPVAECHRWKEVVFVYSFIHVTDIY